ncbi:MAG: putative Se/S carrier-like protein [Lachnospiraceae bacterium]
MFFSTSDVFEAEEKINDAGSECKIVPTPVTDKAYCGVCVQTEDQDALAVVEGMEFQIVD